MMSLKNSHILLKSGSVNLADNCTPYPYDDAQKSAVKN